MTDRTRRRLELAGVVATGLVFLAIPKPPVAVLPLALFIPTCVALWGAHAAFHLRADPTLAATWGLRPSANLGPLLRAVGPAFVVAAAAVAAIGRPVLAPWLWLSLLVYPVWGLVQQWIVQALFVDNLRVVLGWRLPALVVAGAVGFGVLHVEDLRLVAATAALGGVYVALFQRWRNLWPLGVAHGCLGSLFYPWVLGRNPLADLLGP